MIYDINWLKKEIERLNKKVEDLDKEEWESEYLNYLSKQELSEKIVVPVYVAKLVEIFGEYFELKRRVELNERPK